MTRENSRRVRDWMTKAYRQQFDVIQPFTATANISGAERNFRPGEQLISDTEPSGEKITFAAEGICYSIERSIFETSCRARKPTTMPS